MAGKGNIFVSRKAWASATPRLLFACIVYSMGSVFFGYDSASFAGVQAFTPYATQFGTYSASTKTYSLPAATASLMNSLPLIGKLIGTIIVGPMTEKLGHKKTMFITCGTQAIGVIIQTTSKHVPQYTVGRVIIYIAVGLVENVVPTYQSEISPAPLRGFFVGSIQLFLTFGSLIAGIVNNYMAKMTTDAGWIIATALQVAPAALIVLGLPFTPNSPRWLVGQDRSEEAARVLSKLRPKKDVDNGICEFEIAAIREDSATTMHKGRWIELFNSKNRRRTGIACSIMSLQQLTGVTFSSSYGPTFYKQVGLGSMAFAYAAINNGVSVVTAMIGMLLLDAFGRRSVTFWGCLIQSLFLFLIGGLGGKSNRTTSDTNGMVASFILYAAVLHCTLGPAAYITSAEVGTAALREKTMAVATAVNVVVSFVVVFTTPYLLSSPYADLGPNLAYLWAGFAILGVAWVWFCMPELKGRNLEEIDQLFDARIPAWKYSGYETTGMSHDLALFEQNHQVNPPKSVEAGAENAEWLERSRTQEQVA